MQMRHIAQGRMGEPQGSQTVHSAGRYSLLDGNNLQGMIKARFQETNTADIVGARSEMLYNKREAKQEGRN